MSRIGWAPRACGCAVAAVLLLYVAKGAPAAAQSAPPAPDSSASLPPVVVETTPAKAKAKSAKRKTTPVAKPAAAPQSVADDASKSEAAGQGAERANGPVKGVLAHQSATGTKTDTPILETPQAISVVTKDQIAAQQSQTITEALRYTPGVSIDSFGASVFFDWIKVRGFNAPQYLDGLRLPADASAFAVPRIEPYGLERLEVLKGPSSGLYGQSEPGGLINMISKRPLDTPHYEVQGTLGSFDRREAAFDIGGPVVGTGDVSYRVVGLVREADGEIDYTEDNKLFIAPSLTWKPTDDTSFTILAHYQRVHNDGYQQYVPGEATLLPNPFGRIPQSRYLGEPGHDGYTLEQGAIGYEFEHRFASGLEFRQNLRYLDVSNDVAALRGDYMADPLTFQPSYDTLIRAPIYTDADARNLAIDNQLEAKAATGPLGHTVLLGLDYQLTHSSNETRSPISPFLTPGLYLPIDVFNPTYGATVPSADMLPAYLDLKTRQEQTGIYVQDQIKLDRWTLTLTGRQDWASVSTTSKGFYPDVSYAARDDTATTGRVGLSYLFDFGLSPYVSYSTSFVPNAGVGPDEETFEPTTGEGKEVGLKFMAPGTNLMLTAALFDILQDNVVTPDIVNPLRSVQTDQARVRGFEFEARGNLTRELEIVGGYSALDPEITKSVAGYAGNYMPNVNLRQASLWAKYTWYDGPLAGLGISAGVRYAGENYGDQANAIRIPSHTLYDAGVSYDFAYLDRSLDGWTAQINGTNLDDTYYVSSCQGALAYCGLGAGRTVLGTLKYTWGADRF